MKLTVPNYMQFYLHNEKNTCQTITAVAYINIEEVKCNFYLIGNKISFNKRTYHIFILLL